MRAMTNEYQKLTLEEAQKRKWRTTQEMTNRNMRIPKGTIVTLIGKCNGWELVGDPCPCCGVAVSMRKVPHWCIEQVFE